MLNYLCSTKPTNENRERNHRKLFKDASETLTNFTLWLFFLLQRAFWQKMHNCQRKVALCSVTFRKVFSGKKPHLLAIIPKWQARDLLARCLKGNNQTLRGWPHNLKSMAKGPHGGGRGGSGGAPWCHLPCWPRKAQSPPAVQYHRARNTNPPCSLAGLIFFGPDVSIYASSIPTQGWRKFFKILNMGSSVSFLWFAEKPQVASWLCSQMTAVPKLIVCWRQSTPL